MCLYDIPQQSICRSVPGKMWILKVALFCLLSYEIVSQTVDPTVELSTGLIKGRTVNTHYDEDTTNYKQRVNTFYGIPYGQAPVGNLRFEVIFRSYITNS